MSSFSSVKIIRTLDTSVISTVIKRFTDPGTPANDLVRCHVNKQKTAEDSDAGYSGPTNNKRCCKAELIV